MSVDDRFEPVTAADVTDERLLVGEFRAFRNEMRSAFELLVTRLLPAIERIEQRLDDHDRWRRDTDQRLVALESSARKKTRK